MSLINEDQIKQALQRLGELAVENGDNIELIVVGGAAMVLAYQARLATMMWTLLSLHLERQKKSVEWPPP